MSAAQLDVQHAAVPFFSLDTEFNLFQSRNSIISPGSCSTTREQKGGKGVFNMREGEGDVEDKGVARHIINTNLVQHGSRFKCCFFFERLAPALQSLDGCQDLIKLITAVSQCSGI